MKSPISFALCLTGILLVLGGTSLRAEDWATTDGKVYKEVSVVKVEPDAVTILHQDGGALVPMAKLPPEIQQRFDYDPVKGKAAAEARATAATENVQALQQAEAMANAALAAQNTSEESDSGTASASVGKTHYTMDDLMAAAHRLSADFSDPTHHSMDSLVRSGATMATPIHDETHHSMDSLVGS